MPFFSRAPKPAPLGGDGAYGEVGVLPCTESSCRHQTGVPCVYTDRRGKQCDTAWCPQHRRVVNGQCYCRRHAGVVIAISGDSPPDVNNRAPSLVNWVRSDVNDRIIEYLNHVAGGRSYNLLIAPVALTRLAIAERENVWECSWKLADHTGIVLAITLRVHEKVQDRLVAIVNGIIVGEAVPPWISWRSEGLLLSPEQQNALRQEFYTDLINCIQETANYVTL